MSGTKFGGLTVASDLGVLLARRLEMMGFEC